MKEEYKTPPCLYQILRRSNVNIDGVGNCETCKRDFLNRECDDYKPIYVIEYWVNEKRVKEHIYSSNGVDIDEIFD